jgi:hypothetical protein
VHDILVRYACPPDDFVLHTKSCTNSGSLLCRSTAPMVESVVDGILVRTVYRGATEAQVHPSVETDL